jgi:pimeloyl-ACP methyl ester carboxylesterase
LEETAENLTIETPPDMINKLAPYAEAGVDRFIMNVNFGLSQTETLDCIQQIAGKVMPHFTGRPAGSQPDMAHMVKAVECAYSVNGDGPPLILIHGIGAARDAWQFMVPLLEKDFTGV